MRVRTILQAALTLMLVLAGRRLAERRGVRASDPWSGVSDRL